MLLSFRKSQFIFRYYDSSCRTLKDEFGDELNVGGVEDATELSGWTGIPLIETQLQLNTARQVADEIEKTMLRPCNYDGTTCSIHDLYNRLKFLTLKNTCKNLVFIVLQNLKSGKISSFSKIVLFFNILRLNTYISSIFQSLRRAVRAKKHVGVCGGTHF